MRWIVAHRTEVVAGGDDPLAKVMLPEAVHDHPRRERMIGKRQPLAQRGPAAASIASVGGSEWRLRLVMAKKLGKSRRDDLLGLAIVTGIQDVRNGRGAEAISNGHCGGQGLRL